MPHPIRFDIRHHGGLWTLSRDDQRQGDYSHVDRATHDAVARARELQDSGEPAQVFVHANDKVIEVDLEPPRENPDLANGAAAFIPSTPL